MSCASSIRCAKTPLCSNLLHRRRPSTLTHLRSIYYKSPKSVATTCPVPRTLRISQIRFISGKKRVERIKLEKKIMSFYGDSDDDVDDFQPVITHGESIVDKKSVFQGHCAAVATEDQTTIFLRKLKENKKIENAFHNMWAFRIDKSDPHARFAGKSAHILQDCDDDGEQAAGGRLLTLLQILNVVNVMVVVTRWYGGIQLGPARFKHINNAARDALVKGGFVNESGAGAGEASGSQTDTKSKGGGKSKNKKKGK